MGAEGQAVTDDEFDNYQSRVARELERCGCDSLWPNECCGSCRGIIDKYLAVEVVHLQERARNEN